MDKLHFFDSIAVKTPLDRVYARLGYREGVTQISPKQRQEIEADIDQAVSVLKLKGAARRISIVSKQPLRLELSKGVVFKSKLVDSVFTGCSELLLMGATAGSEIINLIGESKQDNLTRGVVFDAVASETVDSALDWIQDYFRIQLKRENKQLISKRISCGYADFSLENQKIIYKLLELDKLGVSLSQEYILRPEKSVTAVTGITTKL